MKDEDIIERIKSEEEVTRSATTNAGLGIGAAAVVAPFVAPYVHELIDKVTGSDDGPHVILPPGVDHDDD